MSGDLRAAVEGLVPDHEADERLPSNWYFDGFYEAQERVLALIPEGAVLVTEETLLTAMYETQHLPSDDGHDMDGHWDEWVAAILRHLREGT